MNILKAPAKINLFFNIVGKRPDGYHLIESLVIFAQDVYDEIEIIQALENKTFIKNGEFSHNLDNNENLIDKALKIFTSNVKYHCNLIKNIPVGAGLGGGSADAGAIVRFLEYKCTDLNEKLLQIGADLPICYYNSPALCKGVGEVIEPVINFPQIHLVLVNPKKSLLTKDVFKNNKIINSSPLKNKTVNFNNNFENLLQFISPLSNNLTISAMQLMPQIRNIINLIKNQQECFIARMSGSGPTCFGIFKTKESAIKAAHNIKQIHPEYWIKYSKTN